MPNTIFDNSKVPVNYLRDQEEKKFDLVEILSILIQNKWLIAFTIAVFLAIGIGKVFIDTPVYQADAMLQVETKLSSRGALEPGVESGGEVSVMTEIELLKSRMIIGAAVKNLNLEIIAEPKYFPFIGNAIARRFEKSHEGNEVSSALFGQKQYAWGGEAIHVDTLTVPSKWLGKELILIVGKQGHFQLLFQNQLVLEGEVGKLASKKLDDTQQSDGKLASKKLDDTQQSDGKLASKPLEDTQQSDGKLASKPLEDTQQSDGKLASKPLEDTQQLDGKLDSKPLGDTQASVGDPDGKQLEDTEQSVTLFVSLLRARPDTQFKIMRQSESNAVSLLKADLQVAEKDRNTGIVGLTLQTTKPQLAVETLNEIANIFVRQNVEQKSAEAQKTLEFLEKQMPQLKEQLDASTSALNSFRTFKGSVDLDLETQHILRGVVELKTQITLLEQKRDELREKFTESHPTVIAVDKQIARLQGQMNSNDKKIQVLPETQQAILRLATDVKVNTELYTALLNNAQTLRVSKAGTVGNVRIIDYAELPTLPVKPKKVMIIAVSTFLGLFLGVALAIIRKLLYRGVEDPDLIEKQLNIPVYATIPHSTQQGKFNFRFRKNYKPQNNELSILALEYKDDLAIESLRSLRTTLHFAFLEAQNNVIMITGPSPNVGKSFVAINLATVLADAGKKILLIDGDLRKGYINKTLGVSREQGLSEFISNNITLDAAIHKIPIANFDFISTGAIPPNPSELLLHERFSHLLTNISKHYDHVIIDSPPVLAVTDAAIIGRMASVTLMVVRSGQHPMRELEQTTKRLTQAGVQLKGVVFNDVPEASSIYGYGKYGRYVYQYSYQKSN